MGTKAATKTKKPKQKQKKHKKQPDAERYHRYELYQRSVQEPEADVEFFNRVYEETRGTRPHILREDFCGTGWICCTWVKDHPQNQAYGYDIDPEPIIWGLENNAADLTTEQRARLFIREGNALDVRTPPVDVLAALNFSYFCFKDRASLRRYFETAYQNLAENGMFVLDIMGGPDVMLEGEEERSVGKFSYIWNQEKHDPITNEIRCSISFKFKDKSRLKRVFEYDWRLWTIPEVREVLAEAGFKDTGAYWEGEDPDSDEGDGNFTREETAETCDCWIAYIVGFK